MIDMSIFSQDQIETAARLVDVIAHLDGDAVACGSRVTCDPAPVDTDADVLLYLDNAAKVSGFVQMASDLGFECESTTEHYQNKAMTFLSFRSPDKINVIVTAMEDFWQKHQVATSICRKMNVMNKQHRILIFQGVLYGVDFSTKPDPFFPSAETLEQWQERNGFSPKSFQVEEIPF